LGAEVADEGLDSAEGQAKLGGDVGLGPVIDEVGAKDLVAAVKWLGGL
jgi:hypothetical protein